MQKLWRKEAQRFLIYEVSFLNTFNKLNIGFREKSGDYILYIKLNNIIINNII